MILLRFLVLLAFASSLFLSGCAYRPDIEQGNVITTQALKRLHKGMTTDQVEKLLGEPILTNIYANNQMIYVYTFKKGRHKMTEKKLIILLRNNVVQSFWTDQRIPQPATAAPAGAPAAPSTTITATTPARMKSPLARRPETPPPAPVVAKPLVKQQPQQNVTQPSGMSTPPPAPPAPPTTTSIPASPQAPTPPEQQMQEP